MAVSARFVDKLIREAVAAVAARQPKVGRMRKVCVMCGAAKLKSRFAQTTSWALKDTCRACDKVVAARKAAARAAQRRYRREHPHASSKR